MKRVAAILLALAMAVPFASCATNDPSKNPGTSARSTTCLLYTSDAADEL